MPLESCLGFNRKRKHFTIQTPMTQLGHWETTITWPYNILWNLWNKRKFFKTNPALMWKKSFWSEINLCWLKLTQITKYYWGIFLKISYAFTLIQLVHKISQTEKLTASVSYKIRLNFPSVMLVISN